MKKKIVMLLAICFFLIVLISVYRLSNREKAAEEMYSAVCDALKDYPVLNTQFVSTFCHFEKDGEKFLVIKSGSDTIVGRQFLNKEAEYYYNGIRYSESNDNAEETDNVTSETIEILCTAIYSLLTDESVTYTYYKPSGSELPLWVSPLDLGYLIIKRDTYGDYMETMIYTDAEKKTIRWSIANDEEDTIMYLYASEELFASPILVIHGWGEIPETITNNFGRD